MERMRNRRKVYISDLQKRMFFLAFVTAFVSAFTQTLAVLIDNVIVCAFYGETEIAAVTLAGPFFYLLEIPAAGLAAGLQTVCAKELGAGRVDRVNRLFNQMLLLAAGVLTAMTVLSFLAVPWMAVAFGARGRTAELEPYAAQYLFGLSFEILPYVLFCIMTPVVMLDNGGRLIAVASVLGCVTDIVLDVVCVRAGWGLTGIGLATSASATVYFLVTMLHFLKRDRVLRIAPVRVRLRELREIFVSAGPKALLSLAEVMRSAVFIIFVSVTGGIAGTFVLSIHGTIMYSVSVFISGIAGAVGVLTGISCGERNGEELEGIGILACRYCAVISAAVMAALGLLARPLSAALTDEGAFAELLNFAVWCVVFTVPLSILVRSRISYLQAVGRIKAARWMSYASGLLSLVAAAGLLQIPFGVYGVFLAFPAAQGINLLIIWAVHAKRTGNSRPSVHDYLEVDKQFFPSPGDVISYPVGTRRECALASEQVILFCRGHRVDSRKGLLAGLCTEELTVNVIQHGLTGKKALNTADLRVAADGEDVILRVRDSGPAFNLKQFADRLAKGDAAGIGNGLRIVLNSAKSVSYYRTYGMNTTIIRI